MKENNQSASNIVENMHVIEELLNSIKKEVLSVSREISELRNEHKTIKEVVYEMKESIFEMKETMDEMKHEIGEIKTKVDDNPTPLWKLVSEWKDVFEKEVLTKLNRTEQKLFSQTCRASREAVRRAKIKLDDEFEAEREFIARTLHAHFDECFRRDELEAGRK